MNRLRAWWFAMRIPRCRVCGALVEQRGQFCSPECEEAWAW